MSIFEPNKLRLWKVLLSASNWGKSAGEARRIILKTYCKAAISERTCTAINVIFNVEGKTSPESVKKLEDAELEGTQ